MKKYILFAPVVVGAFVLGTVGWWQTAHSEPAKNSLQQTPVERLNTKARAAKDNDLASVESLATALIANLVNADLPDDIRSTIQTRLVAAEHGFRQGHKGISEAQVVRTVNELVKEFGAPEYAKTSISQVRFLRASMMGVFPQLLVPQRLHPSQRKEPSSQQPLSPMGATLLTTLLLQQKLINEEFQVEPGDWHDHLQKKNTEAWRAYRENKRAATPRSPYHLGTQPDSAKTPVSGIRPDTAKTKELRQVIEQRLMTMTHADIINLTSATLDQLGLPR